MERLNWNEFKGFLKVNKDLAEFIETDCLHGLISVYKFYCKDDVDDPNEKATFDGNVTHLFELYNLVNVPELNAVCVEKGETFGFWKLTLANKLSIREILERKKRNGKCNWYNPQTSKTENPETLEKDTIC